MRAADWQVLVDLHTSPGMTNEAIRIYLARELTDVAEGDRHAAEAEELELTVRRVPLDEAVADALDGTLTNAAAVAGVLAAAEARSSRLEGPAPGRRAVAGPARTVISTSPRRSGERVARGFLDHLAVERGVAANTLASYRRDLRPLRRLPRRARHRLTGRRGRDPGEPVPGRPARR